MSYDYTSNLMPGVTPRMIDEAAGVYDLPDDSDGDGEAEWWWDDDLGQWRPTGDGGDGWVPETIQRLASRLGTPGHWTDDARDDARE